MMANIDDTPRHEPNKEQGLRWLFFGFSGRIARQSFILSIIFQIILLTLVVYQAVVAGQDQDQGRLAFAGLLSLAVMAFCLWSMIALSIKRLHDLDHPAALCLLLFAPGVNWLWLLYLMARPSVRKTNAHGPPPQG